MAQAPVVMTMYITPTVWVMGRGKLPVFQGIKLSISPGDHSTVEEMGLTRVRENSSSHPTTLIHPILMHPGKNRAKKSNSQKRHVVVF